MSEKEGGSTSGTPEQVFEKLFLVIEEVEGEHFIASPQSDSFFPLDQQEVRWLSVLAGCQDGVTVKDALTPEDEVSIDTYINYRQARESVISKVNGLFDREVLQVTQPADKELLHASSDTHLDIGRNFRGGLNSGHMKPVYGHPSTLLMMGAEAILEAKGYSEDNPPPPQERLIAESLAMNRYGRNPHTKRDSRRSTFTERNPLLAAAMHRVMQRTIPGASKEDLDWMTQARCIGADPAVFSSQYKNNLNFGKDYCAECKVSEQCYGFAVSKKIKEGVWGGSDAKERRDQEFTANVARVRRGLEEVLPEGFFERRQRIAAETARWLRLYLNDMNQSALKEAQVPAFESMAAHLEQDRDNPDGFVSMPTGTGKSVLFVEAIRAAGLRTVVLVPTRNLVHQTVGEFERFHAEGDVGKIYSAEKQTGKDITVTTYASFVRHVTQRTGLFSPEDIEVLVLDEAHRSLSDRNSELLGMMQHVLRIGFTATDEYDSEKTLTKILPHEIYRMEIPQAIDTCLIAPYQTLLAYTNTDLSGVRISASTKDYVEKDLSEAINNLYRNELAAKLYLDHFKGERAIFFCASIKHAKATAAQLCELGVRAEAIYGKIPEKKQKQMLDAHRSSSGDDAIDVLCGTNNLLAEGWDNPMVTVCFNLAPTLSKVVARQRAGRVLRRNGEELEKVAMVVDFIDQQHQRPPVIFADPDVAQKAAYFAGGTIDFNRMRKVDTSDDIVADPDEIESRAYEMNRQRREAAGLAPYDWVMLPSIVDAAIEKAGIADDWAEILRQIYLSSDDTSSVQEILTIAENEHPGGHRYFSSENGPYVLAFSPESTQAVIEELSTVLKKRYGGLMVRSGKRPDSN